MKRKAFTLIEMMIVVAIIAILAAIAIPNFLRAVQLAKIEKAGIGRDTAEWEYLTQFTGDDLDSELAYYSEHGNLDHFEYRHWAGLVEPAVSRDAANSGMTWIVLLDDGEEIISVREPIVLESGWVEVREEGVPGSTKYSGAESITPVAPKGK